MIKRLILRLFGIKVVAFTDRRSAQKRLQDQTHARLAKELGLPWRVR